MAAGTVISGGFPGRVAQEVQSNPKCNGCLHFDGQAGRIGACTIGSKPWLCGEGDAADIGYAPISRGAGKYLPDMNTHGAHAPAVGDQDTADMYGAGSTRPVTFQQVTLGEEHVHFAKSFIAQHDTMQKSMCRLCKSTNMLGTTHSNIGPQVCTCETITARDVAKALAPRLSNLEKSVVSMNDLTMCIRAWATSNFNPSIVKGTFYHAHGKYEVSPAGGGSGDHHVDFHPKGGGSPTRVATVTSRGAARKTAETHARRFASGTGADNAAPHTTHNDDAKTGRHEASKTGARTLPSMHAAVSVAKKGESDEDDDVEKGERVSFKNEDDTPHVEHPRSWVSHAKVSHGTYTLSNKGSIGASSEVTYHGHDGGGHVTSHTSEKEARSFVRQHHAEKTGQPVKGQQAGAKYLHHFGKSLTVNGHTIKPHGEPNNLGQPHALTNNATGKTTIHASRTAAKQAALGHAGAPKGTPVEKSEDEDDIDKAIDNSKHSHIVSGRLAPEGRGYANVKQARNAVDKMDMKYGASAHTYKPNPNFKPPTAAAPVEKSLDEIVEALTKAAAEIEMPAMNMRRPQKEIQMPAMNVRRPAPSAKQVGSSFADAMTGASKQVEMPKDNARPSIGYPRSPTSSRSPSTSKPAVQTHTPTSTKQPSSAPVAGGMQTSPKVERSAPRVSYKSLDALLTELHEEEDVEKSLRWSHKAPGSAKTSHGSYTVGAHPDGGHTVTYTNKETGVSHAKTFASHREALGAVTEHHLKNRPPPKPRKKKDPNAPKAPKAAAPASPC